MADAGKGDWVRETEIRDAAHDGLEERPTSDILAALLHGQKLAISAVEDAMPQLGEAVDAAASRLSDGRGRLVYVGAGTSGRLAILDGVELVPTFGWPRSRLVFLLAGGMEAMTASVEGAEDDASAGLAEITQTGIEERDVVIGLAASGGTPYTRAAIMAARDLGAMTVSFANNPGAPLLNDAEFGILLRTGPEVLAGSTRLAAGTSQKAALNLFSTALMARLHKIHRGYMVDMLPSNTKLLERAETMLCAITDVDAATARASLEQTNNRIKPAVLVSLGATVSQAEALLSGHNGNLTAARKAFENS